MSIAETRPHVSRSPKFVVHQTPLLHEEALYTVRFARTEAEIDAALRLRFEVFNLEMNEGLDESFASGRDEDGFDQSCKHLIVIENLTSKIVGTYRVRTLEMARSAAGFYSAGMFTVESLPLKILSASLETGRACIAKEHRNSRVLFLLWKGIAGFALQNGKRFIFGCCSLPTVDEAEGNRAYDTLVRDGHLHPAIRVNPRPEFACQNEFGAASSSAADSALPKLFQTYLRIGAKICGPPIVDRQFKTIDFFILVDSKTMPSKYYRMFFA